ncbi:MAG TPA: serine/threonine-protein kinase [Dehalococcoidia bacterium]|nr:serine/threonine-protein kinase [Dehalococcoidia bacterium]
MTSPQTFGRYELLGILGGGGFATVYRALDPALGREVALKALLPHLAADAVIRQRFLAEARAIAALHHPNIVTVYDVGEADGRPFFAMELIAGETLAAALTANGRFAPARAAELLRGLCSAVDALHAAGIVHRDIKPANVMIEPGGRVVLMDFGIARTQGGSSYTRAGDSIGTPRYMAPEQVRGVDVGPAADVYALGVLGYELLAGKPPFVGDTASVLHAQVYDPPPPLREACPGLPEGVYAAIESALAKSPPARPASAGAFAAQLQAALSSATPNAATLVMPARPQDQERTLLMPPEPAPVAEAPEAITLPATPVPPPPATPAHTPQPTSAFTPQYVPAYPDSNTPSSLTPAAARSGRGKRTLILAIGAIIATLAVGGAALAAVLIRGRGGNTPATATSAAASATAPPAASATTGGAGTRGVGGAATVSNLQVYDSNKREHAGTFPAGDFVDVCFSLTPGAAAARPLIALTNHDQPPRGDNDPALVGLSPPLALEPIADKCFEVRSTRQRFAPGDFFAWVMQGPSLGEAVVLASAPFHLSPATAASATASATPSPAPTATPRPTPSPTRAAALPTPDLSLPPNPNAGAGRPALKITAVQAEAEAPAAGGTFTFQLTAQNFGAAGSQGSITVSSPDATRLAAQLTACDLNARANVFPPGSSVSTLGNGTRAGVGKAASTQWIAEADVSGAWPAGGTCTLAVSATAPASGNLTLYLRVATFASDDRLAVWPYTGSGVGSVVEDQQGFRAIRWTLPIAVR